MRYIQKDYQTTPTTGVIEDSMESDSHSNAPSINAVKIYVDENAGSANLPKGLGTFFDGEEIPQGWEEAETPISVPNLLINGDFQINQRGKSEYTAVNNSEYTLDMWQFFSSYGSIKPVEGGLQITISENSGDHVTLQQFLEHDYRGEKLTLSLKVDDIIHYKTFDDITTETTTVNITDNVIAIIYYDTSKNKTGVWIKFINESVNLKYLYLYEGDFLCRHIPEDKAIASYRCKRYIQWLKIPQRKTYYSTNYHSGENFEVEMANAPTVIHSDVRNANSGVVDGTVFEAITKRGIGVLLVNEEIISAEILVSCEP